MPLYAYRARDEAGRSRRGRGSFASPRELASNLRAEGLYLVDASTVSLRRFTVRGRVPRKELILFTFHLQSIVAGGIPLLVGLRDLAAETSNRTFRRVVEDLESLLARGSTLSQALARHPEVFSNSYVRMVEAGEAGGRLDECLGRLVHLLEWTEELRSQLRQLVAYPIVVIVALLGLVGLLLGWVLPRFRSVLDSLQVELPWNTRVLLGASSFLVAHWLPLVAGLAAALVAWRVVVGLERVRVLLDAWALRLPVVGKLQQGLVASQIAHFLGAFTETGVPIGTGLELVAGVVNNRHVSRRLHWLRDRVLGGETLTTAFRQAEIVPSLVLRMVAIGEETGTLAESLAKARAHYDRELPRQVKALFDVLSPVLTILLGIALLFVILSVLLPIYKLYGAIEGG